MRDLKKDPLQTVAADADACTVCILLEYTDCCDIQSAVDTRSELGDPESSPG